MYTLDYVDKYLDEKLDKMGSDYFPLPIKFNFFKTATLDLIRESTKFIEVTQEISDDIKDLIVIDSFVDLVPKMIERVDSTLVPSYEYHCAYPDNYLRLISIKPLYEDGNVYKTKFNVVNIIKEGQDIIYNRDPFKKPTMEYPNVFRKEDFIQIDFGDKNTLIYPKAYLSFVKKPTFADINNMNDRIVDLTDISIEKIIDRTANSLRFKTADSAASSNYQFDNTFGKRNK